MSNSQGGSHSGKQQDQSSGSSSHNQQGGNHGGGNHQQSQSGSAPGQQGGNQSSSHTRGGTSEQHAEAGRQSHKNNK